MMGPASRAFKMKLSFKHYFLMGDNSRSLPPGEPRQRHHKLQPRPGTPTHPQGRTPTAGPGCPPGATGAAGAAGRGSRARAGRGFPPGRTGAGWPSLRRRPGATARSSHGPTGRPPGCFFSLTRNRTSGRTGLPGSRNGGKARTVMREDGGKEARVEEASVEGLLDDLEERPGRQLSLPSRGA